MIDAAPDSAAALAAASRFFFRASICNVVDVDVDVVVVVRQCRVGQRGDLAVRSL